MAVSVDDVDLELIAQARRGRREALDELVRRHDRWVRHVVYAAAGHAHDLDDIVQHVWTRVWQQLDTLADPTRWRGWLYTMARNAAIDAGQKSARRRKLDGQHLAEKPPAATWCDPAQTLERKEEHRRVLAAIRGLPPIYREPFVLRHLEDWSYAQISQALSLPVDTVETRLVRARRLLRETLCENQSGAK